MKRTHADAFPVSIITSPLADTNFEPLCLDLFAEAILMQLDWHDQRALAYTSARFYEYLMGTEDKPGRARISLSLVQSILERLVMHINFTTSSYRNIASILHVVLERNRNVLPPAWRPFLHTEQIRFYPDKQKHADSALYHYVGNCVFSFAGILVCEIPLVVTLPTILSFSWDLNARFVEFKLDDTLLEFIHHDNIKVVGPAVNHLVASLVARGPASKKRRLDASIVTIL